MLNFSEPQLVSIYGSWVRVYSAFYGFLLDSAPSSSESFEELARKGVKLGLIDIKDLHESIASEVEAKFNTPEDAWSHFVNEAYHGK